MAEGDDWKKEYFRDDFSVNSILSKCTQKKEFTDVTKRLNSFGSELQVEMTSILKERTEYIIKIARGMNRVQFKIADLKVPLMQFYEEIFSLFKLIKETENFCKSQFDSTAKHQLSAHYIELVQCARSVKTYIENCIDRELQKGDPTPEFYDRVIDKLCFSLHELKRLTEHDSVIINWTLQEKLSSIMEKMFIDGLTEKDETIVYYALRGLVSLERQSQAEKQYTTNFTFPALNKIFSKKNFEKNKHRLRKVFNTATEFIDTDLIFLLNIIKKHKDLKGFDFLTNSYWSTADKLLRQNLPQTTASGNPEQFRGQFMDTWNFLNTLTRRYDFDAGPSFVAHMKRFNLDVYFEIRHQQICSAFEGDIFLSQDVSDLPQSEDKQFRLLISESAWKNFNKCFAPDVYLNHVFSGFARLASLVISRYKVHLIHILEKAVESSKVNVLVDCLLDVRFLRDRFGKENEEELKGTVFKQVDALLYPHLEVLLSMISKKFEELFEITHDRLISMFVDKATTQLQQVGSIPRLYRRTNKSIPSEPSNYVTEIIQSMESFYQSHNEDLKDICKRITTISISKIAIEYLSVIRDVLNSISKTEESLRRLKSRNSAATETSSEKGDMSTDEAKIREQIRLDVEYFLNHFRPITSEPDHHELLQTLKTESERRT